MKRAAPGLAGLARRFGTPLYVYDFDALSRRADALVAALAPRFTAAYAVKANPSLAVVSFLGSKGLGADVASKGELAAVLRAGVQGPCAQHNCRGTLRSCPDAGSNPSTRSG